MSKRVLISHPHWKEVKSFTPALAEWVLSKGDAYKVVQPRFQNQAIEPIEGLKDAENASGNKSDSPSTKNATGDSEGRRSRGTGKASQ